MRRIQSCEPKLWPLSSRPLPPVVAADIPAALAASEAITRARSINGNDSSLNFRLKK